MESARSDGLFNTNRPSANKCPSSSARRAGGSLAKTRGTNSHRDLSNNEPEEMVQLFGAANKLRSSSGSRNGGSPAKTRRTNSNRDDEAVERVQLFGASEDKEQQQISQPSQPCDMFLIISLSCRKSTRLWTLLMS